MSVTQSPWKSSQTVQFLDDLDKTWKLVQTYYSHIDNCVQYRSFVRLLGWFYYFNIATKL